MIMKIFIPETEREAAIEWKMRQLIQELEDARLQMERMKKDYDNALKEGRELGISIGYQSISEEHVHISKLLDMTLREFIHYVEDSRK